MFKSILNTSKNCYIKRNQALSRIECFVSDWVVRGESIRDLSLAEVMERRAHHRTVTSGLEAVEAVGCKYEPPMQDRAKFRERNQLVIQARQFYEAAIS